MGALVLVIMSQLKVSNQTAGRIKFKVSVMLCASPASSFQNAIGNPLLDNHSSKR